MQVKTRSGRVLSDADLDRPATEAEAGFDVSTWRPRRGRPSLVATAGEHSPRIAVRVPEGLRQEVATRAAAEGKSLSEVVRSLLEGYAGSVPSELSQAPRRRTVARTRRRIPARKA